MSYVEAFPYIDWNEKIYDECYRPFLERSLFSRVSFDFGPTLTGFLALRHPDFLGELRKNKNAIFHPFYHVIYPLAGKLEKKVNTFWGLMFHREFFGFSPVGAWLPEAAVDVESLKVLHEAGIKFVVLGSHQLTLKEGRNNSSPGFIDLGGDASIFVFPFHRERSNELSFGKMLDSDVEFVRTVSCWFKKSGAGSPFVLLATDGETFGHHRRGAVEVLDNSLKAIAGGKCGEVSVLADLNEAYRRFAFETTSVYGLRENTSWSCSHGIERWRDDCGCNSGANPSWNQKWRKPLREAMDFLGRSLEDIYFTFGEKVLKDPEEALLSYWKVLYAPVDYALEGRSAFPGGVNGYFSYMKQVREKFFIERLSKDAGVDSRLALRIASFLLEGMNLRFAMMTSCGWFFDDVKSYEATQNIRLAKGALRFFGEAFKLLEGNQGKIVTLEKKFKRILASARSNMGGDASEVYNYVVEGEEKRALPERFFLTGGDCFKRFP